MADRLLDGERDAHVPVQQLLEVDEVLLPLRLVQPELDRESMPELRGGLRHPGAVGHRVARQDAEQEEIYRDRDEYRHQREEASLDHIITEMHRLLLLPFRL